MEKEIIILVDYKGHFGSKYNDFPYRSGFDKDLLAKLFSEKGYSVTFVPMADAADLKEVNGKIVLYQSSEDIGYHYKKYIEDIILSLEYRGALVLPRYKYLRANNNKVFMELIRKDLGHLWGDTLQSWVFGCFEEMLEYIPDFEYPLVIKTAEGAMSSGVFLAHNETELKKVVKRISRSSHIINDIKDYFRLFRHKLYVRESLYRNKFVVQQFIKGLSFDYKVLIFGDKYFVFKRSNRKDDFRASGSGNLYYKYGNDAKAPEELYLFAERVYKTLNVPNLSIDVGMVDGNFYLIEFQAVYFGSVGVLRSKNYVQHVLNEWVIKTNSTIIEEFYVNSIVEYIGL